MIDSGKMAKALSQLDKRYPEKDGVTFKQNDDKVIVIVRIGEEEKRFRLEEVSE